MTEETLAREAAEAQGQIASLRGELEVERGNTEAATTLLAEASSARDALQAIQESVALEASEAQEQAQEQVASLQQDAAALRGELDSWRSDAEGAMSALAEAQTALAASQAKEESLALTIDQTNSALEERERKIAALEQQMTAAATALEASQANEEARSLEVSENQREMASLEERLSTLGAEQDAQREANEATVAALQAQMTETAAALEASRAAEQNLALDITEAESEVTRLEGETETLRSELATERGASEEGQTVLADLQRQLADADAALAASQANEQSLDLIVAASELQLASLDEELATLRAEMDRQRAAAEASATDLRQQLEDRAAALQQSQDSVQAHDRTAAEAQQHAASLETELAALLAEHEQLRSDTEAAEAALQDRLSEVADTLQVSRTNEGALSQQIAEAQDQVSDLEAEVARLQSDLADQQAESAATDVPEPETADTPVQVDALDLQLVTLGNANVRSDPSADTESLQTISAGTAVTVTGKVIGQDWYRIALPGNNEGYVWAPLLVGADHAGTTPLPIQVSSDLEVGEHFRDCESCPEMVVVPAGSFEMGSPDDEDGRREREGPRHTVSIERAFASGLREVTFAEWDACVLAEVCGHSPDDGGWGREDRPVVDVSWVDAQEYVAWLSHLTGHRYRLLAETEWAYVARAGSRTAYWWGRSIGDGKANCRDCGSDWDDSETAPSGSFDANAFGLYDVHGNVWEWVEDCWHVTYAGAPDDGTAWVDRPDCRLRVLRGGAWNDEAAELRSANRDWSTTKGRDNDIGFRVARELN